MEILRTSVNDADIIANIISQSNREVAVKFNINADNNPKHPSFYTENWVLSDFNKGEQYFLYRKDNLFVACVAFEVARPGVAYLNRLS